MDFIIELIKLYYERREFFITITLEHLFISLTSIILATIIGVSVGIFTVYFKKTESIILAITNIMYTIPTIALLGILISFTGVGNTSAIIALVIYGLLPMVRATNTGIKNIDKYVIESAEGMGTSKLQMLYKVKLPLALPVIFSGFRSMSIMTISLAGVASFIGAGGLGVAIYRGIATNNSLLTVAGSLLIAVLAIVVDYIFSILEKDITSNMYKSNKKKYLIYSSTIVLLIIIFWVQRFNNMSDRVVIATKPHTEQFILGEMKRILIEEHSDIKVHVVKGVGGGTSNIHPGMLSGAFDIYPEYTGTAWSDVLGKDFIEDIEEMNKILKEEYIYRFGLKWVGLYGFNNTFGLAVDYQFAIDNNINTFSDLAEISHTLTFGAEHDFFERQDGFIGLVEMYGFEFNQTMDMDIGLKYEAITSGEVDVINIFTTDSLVEINNLKVLEDDKGFFASYYAGTIARVETLQKHQELEEILSMLNGAISNEDMMRMNLKVEYYGMYEGDVAREFLKRKGLI
jgi:osmoprotectant transport system permease protein